MNPCYCGHAAHPKEFCSVERCFCTIYDPVEEDVCTCPPSGSGGWEVNDFKSNVHVDCGKVLKVKRADSAGGY